MPRQRALVPTEPIKIYFTLENASKLRLAAFSALRGKLEHGEISRIVNSAVEAYFTINKESQDVQPGNSSPSGRVESTSSDPRPDDSGAA